MSRRRLAVISLVVWTIVQSTAEAQPLFQGIGVPPGDVHPFSLPERVSADGSVVVGRAWSDVEGGFSFRWTAETGLVSLGTLPGGSSGAADDVSADGSVVVGRAGSPESSPNVQAYRWTEATGMVGLGDLPGGFFISGASGASGDGSVVVGGSDAEPGPDGFRWTEETGMVPLGPGCSKVDFVAESATAISDDGSVIVGIGGWCEGGGSRAFRWTEEEGAVSLGVIPLGGSSRASDVSADGLVVVGWGTDLGGLADEGFRWRAQSGMVGLGHLPGGLDDSLAFGVSGDGSIVVGMGCVAGGPIFCSDSDAFIWDIHHGMRNLQEVVEDAYGFDLGGWELNSASDISADGLVIIGNGGNPIGQAEGWILRLPDCNANGQADDLDILDGISSDDNGNVIPDECEPDCNDNGQDDADDIKTGTSDDCNGNNIPDECEADCNANGQPDACDIEQGVSDDCNGDYIPDECDPFPPIIEQPEDQGAEPGDSTYFLTITEGDGLTYQWLHDGVELEDDERIFGSQDFFLVIFEVIPKDAGVYECVITDQFSGCTNTTDPATLTVLQLCPADFDDNGSVGPFDLAILLGNWGPNPDHPADLNADGTVNAYDLALLLGHWGPCP